MVLTSLPLYFKPDAELATFLLANGFREVTHESEAARAQGSRDFRHPRTGLFVCVAIVQNVIVLESAHGWLWHHYTRLDSAALVYLLLRYPANEVNRQTYFMLADSSPWTLPA